ncbi:MAG: ABC transporter ATP-binding protein [Verrucomicrobiales bacterium]
MIEVNDLHKHFGHKRAVNGISFKVNQGEVLGFLGPNGAGKSTTMRIITGYLQAISGSVTIGGHDVSTHPEDAKRLIGYLPESAPLYTDMSVSSFLGFCAEMRGLRSRAIKEATERVIEMCFLEKVRHQSIDTLSKGYRHRTCLAQSLIHDPAVLILDEPTDGLDPNQKHEIRTLIKEMGKTKTIIFSTHILEEVEAACSRAIIIDQGVIVADGTPSQLLLRSPNAGHIHFRIRGLAGSGIAAEIKKLGPCADVESIEAGESHLVGRAIPRKAELGKDLAAAISELCRSRALVLESLHEDTGKLDEFFRHITSGDTGRAA